METVIIRLSEVPPCCAAIVEGVEECAMKPRLEGLGFTGGACAVRLFSAAGGDPTAYSIRGTVVALRSRDAAKIIVRSFKNGIDKE